MKLTCYSWPDCPHTVHLNESGTRMDVDEIRNPKNHPIDQEVATFPCPACSDPDASQHGIGTRPIPNAPAIPMPVSMMNPKVRDFRPSSYPHESSFIGSSSGYGHNRAMSHPGPNYYSHGNMYHNAPPGMVYPDQFPLTSTGHPAPYGQLAQHAPNPAALTYKTPTKKEIKAMAAARDAHKPGKQCPEGHAFCHWHYANWCHDDPATCRPALQAITAAFHAHSPWKDAPEGWNAAHETCIRKDDPIMCAFHAQLHRRKLGSSH